MTKTIKLSAKEQVTQHIQKLDPSVKKVVEAIRNIILSTDNKIDEQIKWNNPAFYYTGAMEPFDPKEYKRDIVVFNLYKERIMLVFLNGAKISDPSGLLEGNYKDGRRTMCFKSVEDVHAKQNALQDILRQCVQLIDKE